MEESHSAERQHGDDWWQAVDGGWYPPSAKRPASIWAFLLGLPAPPPSSPARPVRPPGRLTRYIVIFARHRPRLFGWLLMLSVIGLVVGGWLVLMLLALRG